MFVCTAFLHGNTHTVAVTHKYTTENATATCHSYVAHLHFQMASSEGVAANLTSMAPTTICGVCHLKTSHNWGKEMEAEYVYYCLHCFMGLICILIPVLAHLLMDLYSFSSYLCCFGNES